MQALLDTIATMALPADAQRVFHGRGGLHPGCEHWALDAFPPVWVLTGFQPATDRELASIGAALGQRWQQLAPGQPLNWVYQCRFDGRSSTRLMAAAALQTAAAQRPLSPEHTRLLDEVLQTLGRQA